MAIRFIDWEMRPAIIAGARAWAILAKGEDWTEVSCFAVSDSGVAMPESHFRKVFADWGNLELPTLASKPAQISPDDFFTNPEAALDRAEERMFETLKRRRELRDKSDGKPAFEFPDEAEQSDAVTSLQLTSRAPSAGAESMTNWTPEPMVASRMNEYRKVALLLLALSGTYGLVYLCLLALSSFLPFEAVQLIGAIAGIAVPLGVVTLSHYS